MSANTKAILISFIIFFAIFIACRLVIGYFLSIENAGVLGAISAVVAIVLSPRRSVIVTQSDKQIYLKWVFSKKMYRIK